MSIRASLLMSFHNSIFPSHELFWRSGHGKWVNTIQNAMQPDVKNSANWCAKKSKEIPCKMTHLILLTLYVLVDHLILLTLYVLVDHLILLTLYVLVDHLILLTL